MAFEKVQSECLEEYIQRLIQLESEELTAQASQLNSQELMHAIALLGERRIPNWQEKTQAIFRGLHTRPAIEQASQALNIAQVLDLLSHREILETKEIWKLSPLFVGMRPSVFREILSQANPEQLQTLKQEGITEPLQHHITILTEDILDEIDELFRQSFYLEMELNALDTTTTPPDETRQFLERIEHASQKAESTLATLNTLLEATWNTSRIDLIEKLTYAKTSLLKIVNQLGHAEDEQNPLSGIYAKLAHHFERIFEQEAVSTSLEKFRDDTPAIEALTHFSIWYLLDYWELGLLPEIATRAELNLDPEFYSEKECLAFREYLFNQVTQNMEKYGLKTVQDLKKNKIFSKRALYEYLKQQRSLME
ncbi:MAG: hypothetical protein IM537_21290 [Pseudanabaena sp. M57BS1SP1A06MG]|nr:hypothetical protein [Pseudanabaena sp. M57BS1SP1A06MG]